MMKSNLFSYIVTTRLWKSPFENEDRSIGDYLDAKRKNAYFDCRTFSDDADPLVARQQAMSYCRSMIDVLCESIGTKNRDYWQALVELQLLLRADHKTAHLRTGLMEYDDDMFMGINITFRVQNNKRTDEMVIFSLPCYQEDHREDVYETIVYNIIALERETTYLQNAKITLNNVQTVNFCSIGLSSIQILPTPLDMSGFLAFYGDFKVDEWLDMNFLDEYRDKPLI